MIEILKFAIALANHLENSGRPELGTEVVRFAMTYTGPQIAALYNVSVISQEDTSNG